VSLETRPIHSITASTIRVTDPTTSTPTPSASSYDLIVCATGFQTLDFMHPITLHGASGRSIHDVWHSGARALYGITVESMPNFGMLYGPNTNLGHNSIILMIEAQSRYINGMIGEVLAAKRAGSPITLLPKAERVEGFNAEIQRELKESVFNDPNCNSWYKNAEGRITNNWSRNVVDYQKLVAEVRLEEDFDVLVKDGGEKGGVVERTGGRKKVHVGRVKEELRPSETTVYVLGAVAAAAAVVGGVLARNPKLVEQMRDLVA
jgi:putative intracellular protease/amidase